MRSPAIPAMRSQSHRNHVTDAQTVHENLNGGGDEVERDNSRDDRLANLEVILHWLGSAVAVAFIGLAIIQPERIERMLTSLMFKALNILEAKLAEEIEPVFEVRWSAVGVAQSDDRIKKIDAELKFNVIDLPPQITDDFDQGSQSQTETTGSAPSSAAGSIEIDQSLAIEFPVAAYKPHKSADAMKRPPLRRAKEVAAKPSVYDTPQADLEANSKPVELPKASAY